MSDSSTTEPVKNTRAKSTTTTAPVAASSATGGGGGGSIVHPTSSSSSSSSSGSSSSTSSSSSSTSPTVLTAPTTAQNITMMNSVSFTAVHLEDLTPEAIKAFKTNRENAVKRQVALDRSSCISEISKSIINMQFVSMGIIFDGDDFETMDDPTLFLNLGRAFGDLSGNNNLSGIDQVRAGLLTIKVTIDPNEPSAPFAYFKKIEELLMKSGMKDSFPPAEEQAMVKLMLDKLQHTEVKSSENTAILKTLSLIKDHVRLKISSISTIRSLHQELLKHFNNVARITAECNNYGLGMHNPKSNKSSSSNSDIKEESNKGLSGGGGGKSQGSTSNPTQTDARKSDRTPTVPCTGCGRSHSGGAVDCSLKGHPDWNHSTTPWIDSEKGKAFVAKEEKTITLPGGRCLDGSTREFSFPASKNNTKRSNGNANGQDSKSKKGKLPTEAFNITLMCEDCNANSSDVNVTQNDIEHTIQVYIHQIDSVNNTNQLPILLPLRALMDTGALHANYISSKLAHQLESNGIVVSNHDASICGVSNTACTKCLGKLNAYVDMFNEVTKQRLTLNMNFNVIQMKYDLIFGKPDIIKHDLMRILYDQFIANSETISPIIPAETNSLDRNQKTPFDVQPNVEQFESNLLVQANEKN